nr:heavy-metal-associated domain-containing protein [Angustibacter aerolatus]
MRALRALGHRGGAGAPGVRDVQVDLGSGQVTVAAAEPLSDDAVRGAVEEAGYALG